MAKQTKKPDGFYSKNTVDVKFPDGKTRRVNKFEAEKLKTKLKGDKFTKKKSDLA